MARPRLNPRQTRSRHASIPLFGKRAKLPPFNHPALEEWRTIYPATVVHEVRSHQVLKGGHNSAKIGGLVLKGKWSGFPIYTLTLEERATCPTSCRHWRSCYGNQMHWAERLAHGEDLEWRLEREVAALSLKHRKGFVVRLHVLGDFYSVAYVDLWRKMLGDYEQLNAFGYSARWDRDDPTAFALINLVREKWERFSIRFSNAPIDECATISLEHPVQKPDDAIICPEQLGLTESCSTCGLCWSTKKRIAFLQH